MKNPRRILAGALAGAAALLAVGTLATSTPASGAAYEYVKVTNQDGVVSVGTQIPGQPLFGASANTRTGRVCLTFSYQVPQCKVLPIGTHTTAAQDPFGGKPVVVVDSDPSDGSVGAYTQLGRQPLLGVRLANGRLCAGFSYQVPFCVEVGGSVS